MKNNNLTVAQRVAKILLTIEAVTLSPRSPYRFTSGILSPVYTDNRLLMNYPFKRKEITIYMANLIKEKGLEPDIIAGTSTAGIPPAAWLAEILNLPMIYVRGEKKHHGKGRQIEGILPKKANVLLIEDLISTGKSSLTAVDAIREEEGKVNTCLAILDYGLLISKNAYRKTGIRLHTLTTIETVLEMAIKMNLIKESEQAIVLDWQKDPQKWEDKIKAATQKETQTEY